MKTALAAVVLLTLAPAALAQCTIDQNLWSGNGGASPPEGVGQSFTACQTGWVTSVSVYVSIAPPPGPVNLQLQPGIAIFPQTAPQSVTLSLGLNTITLDDPLPVVSGQQYSWGMLPTSGALWLRFNQGDVYPDGAQIHYNGLNYDEFFTRDYVFGVAITDDETVANEALRFGALKARYR